MTPIAFDVWLEINTRLQAYSDAIDRGDVDGILAVFTPNAVWDYTPGAPRQGRSEIGSMFQKSFLSFARTSHNVCPPRVRAAATPGTFESVAYFIATHLLTDAGRYTVYGRYIDDFQRMDGLLLISRRRVVAHVVEGTTKPRHFLERMQA